MILFLFVISLYFLGPIFVNRLQQQSYDYIIVGGGAAGGVIARRLVDRNFTVLLLEAGGPSVSAVGGKDIVIPPPLNCDFVVKDCGSGRTWFEVPAFTSMTWYDRKYFWIFPTNNDIHCAKVLGGGGTINGLVFLRRIPYDFEGWPQGWQFKDFLPYYILIENVTTPELRNSPLRGTKGLIKVSRNISVDHDYNASLPFMAAAKNYGIPINPDLNGESRYGVGLLDLNIADGIRQTSVQNYLAPIWNNPHLFVKLFSEATQILFNSNQAVGVQYFDHKTFQTNTATATKEIILSAGAIGSPKLLMLSGIGDPKILNPLNIPVVSALPKVGTTLKNHPHIGMNFKLKPGYGVPPMPYDWQYYYKSYNEGNYLSFGSAGLKISQLFVSSTGNTSIPNIQVEYFPDSDSVSFDLQIMNAYTQGWVRLVSKNPLVAALVELHDPYDERDIDTFVWAINFIRNLTKTPPFLDMIDHEVDPGTSLTPDQLRNWIKEYGNDYVHYTGTCALGSVVDTSLKVLGVNNLRVADASVLLHSGNGNTHNTVLAVGEIASDIILGNKKL